MPGLKELDPALWPGHSALLGVHTPDAPVSAAQMNTIEFHTWNSTVQDIDRPDRVIFDLDPGEGVTWKHLREAAVLTLAMLTELQLESWLKTSGGKGLHVVVPLAPEATMTTSRRGRRPSSFTWRGRSAADVLVLVRDVHQVCEEGGRAQFAIAKPAASGNESLIALAAAHARG